MSVMKKLSPNAYRAAHAAGRWAVGFTVQMGSPEIVEAAGYAGYDFVWIDAEHGTLDLSILVSMFRAAEAAGIASVVRVPDLTPSFITRVLDAGGNGIIGPHICTREDAEALVRAVKFAPAGGRGACPSTRATGHTAFDWTEFRRFADQDTIVWALIEDAQGVENIDAIAAVPGLDAILFGPFDLSQSLGHGGDIRAPVVLAAREKVLASCQRAGVELVSIVSWEPDGLAGAKARKARVLAKNSDRGLLMQGMKADLASLKQ
jgi:2-keto-3-deoxy-L-rhamnonate aldolase RhmA